MKSNFKIGKQIIPAGFRKIVKEPIKMDPGSYLRVAEFFCDTIQGENFVGFPATFLRLQGCTLDCVWCDSNLVWRQGNPFTFEELFTLMESSEFNLIRKFKEGQHLVLTGGSPLKQQTALINFLSAFQDRYGFTPYTEIENECTLMPDNELMMYIDCWNNSPKLADSENPESIRYNPEVLRTLSRLSNSWFKFVISSKEQWKEIEDDFLIPKLIKKEQIVLMPLGIDREEIMQNAPIAVELAVEKGVRYTSREHITIWNKKTGI